MKKSESDLLSALATNTKKAPVVSTKSKKTMYTKYIIDNDNRYKNN